MSVVGEYTDAFALLLTEARRSAFSFARGTRVAAQVRKRRGVRNTNQATRAIKTKTHAEESKQRLKIKRADKGKSIVKRVMVLTRYHTKRSGRREASG